MVFWTGILVGGLFVWLAVKMGFYETWTLLFNCVISVYVALLLTPVVVDKVPAAGETAYGNALTLLALAVAAFLILCGASYTLITSRFNVSLPKIFDNLGAGLLGFLAGLLIWSFAALLVSATPLAQKGIVRDIGFGPKIEQSNAPYIYWWCDLVDSVAAADDSRQSARDAVKWLLDNAQQKPQEAPDQPDPNTAPDPARRRLGIEDI